MPLSINDAPPIRNRSYYWDKELNKFVQSLQQPPTIQILKFGTLEVVLESGVKTKWANFVVRPETNLILLPVNFSYGKLSETFQKGTHTSEKDGQVFLTDHSAILLINISANSYTVYDADKNAVQRNYMRKSLQYKLRKKLKLSTLRFENEFQVTSEDNGCALSACTIMHLIIRGQDPNMMIRQINPPPALNRLQYNALNNTRSKINNANQ